MEPIRTWTTTDGETLEAHWDRTAEANPDVIQLISFGERHIFDRAGYDFFAVSMPELEVYQDDIQKRSDDYCRRLMALGRKGLRETGL